MPRRETDYWVSAIMSIKLGTAGEPARRVVERSCPPGREVACGLGDSRHQVSVARDARGRRGDRLTGLLGAELAAVAHGGRGRGLPRGTG
jgi:hypothetical protein